MPWVYLKRAARCIVSNPCVTKASGARGEIRSGAGPLRIGVLALALFGLAHTLAHAMLAVVGLGTLARQATLQGDQVSPGT